MTIATYHGFKIGELYRVIDENETAFYKQGMIVKFVKDDGTDCPYFTYVSGDKGALLTNPRQNIAVRLSSLEPVEPEKLLQVIKLCCLCTSNNTTLTIKF